MAHIRSKFSAEHPPDPGVTCLVTQKRGNPSTEYNVGFLLRVNFFWEENVHVHHLSRKLGSVDGCYGCLWFVEMRETSAVVGDSIQFFLFPGIPGGFHNSGKGSGLCMSVLDMQFL